MHVAANYTHYAIWGLFLLCFYHCGSYFPAPLREFFLGSQQVYILQFGHWELLDSCSKIQLRDLRLWILFFFEAGSYFIT